VTGLWLGLGAAGAVGLVALLYWQFVIAEGAYLGPRVVAWTYDWAARRYDAIKQFNTQDERWFVAVPVLQALAGVEWPLVLDVATGTGRLPETLLRNGFLGHIVGLDLSLGMLRRARSKLSAYGDLVHLVWQDAGCLPFDDGTFDAVTCLEALEFLPRPLEALAEMVRVLAPGGVLFVTNRVGREARLLPGRAIPRQDFSQELAALPLSDVHVRAWQTSYDLTMASKAGERRTDGGGRVDLESVLRCPRCGGTLTRTAPGFSCRTCEQGYAIRQGIVRLEAGNSHRP
jgi:ubiquinone/menaquinone biosynthesis C-methylase UbiE